jgi:membrane-associated phospholipid phosphatase
VVSGTRSEMAAARMGLRTAICLLLTCLNGLTAVAQDTTKQSSPVPPAKDSSEQGLKPAATTSKGIAGRVDAIARRGERIVFDTDSTVERFTRRTDPASRFVRRVSPVGFWVPVIAVAAQPMVWADEAKDGNESNAQYARAATAALAIGLLVSRTTKHFVHRARPCAGATNDSSDRAPDPAVARCARGSGVRDSTSFFSEHAMALFSIAAAESFYAQRANAPNATLVTASTFATAGVLSLGRIYQGHHWLSDVVVGAAVGTASGLLAAQLGPAARVR